MAERSRKTQRSTTSKSFLKTAFCSKAVGVGFAQAKVWIVTALAPACGQRLVIKLVTSETAFQRSLHHEALYGFTSNEFNFRPVTEEQTDVSNPGMGLRKTLEKEEQHLYRNMYIIQRHLPTLSPKLGFYMHIGRGCRVF